jgi:MFS family permease
VNVLFGAGAAVGAVVGGAIADAFGWRAAFWIQVPLIAFAAALIIAKVNVGHEKGDKSAWEKLIGIDWAGSAALVFSVSSRVGT